MTRQVPEGLPPAPDSLRAVLDSVFADPGYAWVERPNPLAFALRWWEALIGWIEALETRNPDVYWLLFGGMLAVLAAVVVHATWVMVRTLRQAQAPANPGEIPAHLVRDATWYRHESARLAAAGRFSEAMQADFLALALELDRRRLLRFHPSKTPEEYAREARLPDTARADFGDLVRTLYGYAFAGVPADAATLDAWRRRTSPDRYAPAL